MLKKRKKRSFSNESENKEDEYETPYDHDELDSVELKNAKFIMKNGCCKECMKAFSKTGKVSI